MLPRPGGIGKISLALAFAHRIRDAYPDGQLHADLARSGMGEPAGPAQMLHTELAAAASAAGLPARAARQRPASSGVRRRAAPGHGGNSRSPAALRLPDYYRAGLQAATPRRWLVAGPRTARTSAGIAFGDPGSGRDWVSANCDTR